MHRIDTSTAQKDKFGAGKNGFTRGNPQTGTPATDLDDDYFDMLQEELAGVVEGAGITLDKSKRGQLQEALETMHLGIVGQSRNARIIVAVASTAATFAADELIVESSSGRQYRLRAFNKNINLTTTGAGGMDTGSVPTTGFIALYAIYNPETQTSSLLSVNATSTTAPEVYSGLNMPSGYTASALVSVWPIAGGQFITGILSGRKLSFVVNSVISTSSAPTTPSPISLIAAVPLNATEVSASVRFLSSAGTGAVGYDIGADVTGIGRAASGGYVTGGASIEFPPFSILLITKQQMYHRVVVSGATSYVYVLYVNGYTI